MGEYTSAKLADVSVTEHASIHFLTSGGHLFLRCGTCMCQPTFDKIMILGKGADETAKKLLEMHERGKEGEENNISQTFVYLREKEIAFLSTC